MANDSRPMTKARGGQLDQSHLTLAHRHDEDVALIPILCHNSHTSQAQTPKIHMAERITTMHEADVPARD